MSNRTAIALGGMVAGFVLLAGLATAVLVRHRDPVRSANNAQATTFRPKDYDAVAMNLDPEDYDVMQPVCTRCHSAGFILHSRPWSNWLGVFQQMYGYGV